MTTKELLAILACPICESRPRLKHVGELLICSECERGFKIVDDIPRMLPEDALPKEEVERLTNGR